VVVEALKHWKRRHWSHRGRRNGEEVSGRRQRTEATWEEGELEVALDEVKRPARWNGAEQLELAPTHQITSSSSPMVLPISFY
jgi:hypothetical protein